ncbi:MAG: hypothetical protein WAQ33_09610, partial [Gaiellaceae bacterium]
GDTRRSKLPCSLSVGYAVEDEGIKFAVRALWVTLLGVAIADAVRNDRRHGEVLGFVPYEFRVPTIERARAHVWSPASRRILTPTTFGLGWSVNLGRLARLTHLL